MKKFLIVIFIVFSLLDSKGQDPQFSQFYSAPLYLGPSFAGSAHATRIGLNFRDQWPKLPGAFITTSLWADHYFEDYKSGAGVMILSDYAGKLMNTTVIAAQYSYHLSVNKRFYVIPGIQAGYTMKRINDNLIFSDQIGSDGDVYDQSIEMLPDDNYSNLDFALSVVGFYDNIWLGASTDHLMKLARSLPEYDNYMPIKFSVYGGVKFDMKKKHFGRKEDQSITTAFNYKTQDNLHQLDFGLYMVRHPLMIGLWYRGIPIFKNTISKDAITTLVGAKAGSFTLAYSYDFTVSSLISTTGGAHEISIIYNFTNEPMFRKRIRMIPCPIH